MSRFVSAGTSDEPTERDEAWLKAQQQIEAARQQTQQKPRPGEQEGGKSLYETLQANKAAKQEAFEEQAKLKNQFRSLDDDEVEFLDSMLESTRAKEAEVKKETRDQLDAFRRHQEDAEKAVRGQEGGGEGESAGVGGGETWAAGPRKRKKGREGLLGGVKVRRTSTVERQQTIKAASPAAEGSPPGASGSAASPPPIKDDEDGPEPVASTATAKAPETKPSPPSPSSNRISTGLGLAAYSSDEDD